MSCKRCVSDRVKDLTAEVAIHFPGLHGLDKPIVFVFPEVQICMNCGLAEFLVPEAKLEALKTAETPGQLRGSAASLN